jgi:antirestriction protein ArdC
MVRAWRVREQYEKTTTRSSPTVNPTGWGTESSLTVVRCFASEYPLNRWLTYRQADELGGQVRRGEHGTAVVFWKLRKVAATAETYPAEDEHDLPDRIIPLLRSFNLFNVAQINGLPPELMTAPVVTWEPEARAEELLLMSGAVIRHGGAQAYYQLGTDEIHLPPRPAFLTSGGYYNVALHELTHWTSHRSRCNRQFIRSWMRRTGRCSSQLPST